MEKKEKAGEPKSNFFPPVIAQFISQCLDMRNIMLGVYAKTSKLIRFRGRPIAKAMVFI